jgi:hypothetical protein
LDTIKGPDGLLPEIIKDDHHSWFIGAALEQSRLM